MAMCKNAGANNNRTRSKWKRKMGEKVKISWSKRIDAMLDKIASNLFGDRKVE